MATEEEQGRPDEAVRHVFQTTRKFTREHRTWFRGEHTNFNPKLKSMTAPSGAVDFVLDGWLPERPLIGHDTRITAFGSCFAVNISDWLARRNFSVLNKAGDADDAESQAYVVTMGEGMVNSFVIRQQFEWAWENKVFEEPLWHGYSAEEFGYDEAVRLETKRLFDETEVFILTFGLSEVWYDEPTGNVFWRTIPKDVYDPDRHKFRVASVEENRENIRAIYDLIRRYRPDARVIVTLSPVPLIATFRDVSCISANSVSKASLRVAIDEVLREVGGDGQMYYWPSYELITDVFRNPFRADRRHMPRAVLDHVMRLFERAWCEGSEVSEVELLESWVMANARAGILPNELCRIVALRRPWHLRDFLASGVRFHDEDEVDEAWRATLSDLRAVWRAEREAEKRETEEV